MHYGLVNPDLASELLETADPKLFSERLLRIARNTSGVVEVFAYCMGDGGPPGVIAASSEVSGAGERRRAYSHHYHASDPVMAVGLATEPGSGFQLRVPSAAIERGEYRKLCFERPCFAGKISFGWRKPGHTLIVSFYHRDEIRSEQFMRLAALAQLTLTGLSRIRARHGRRNKGGAVMLEIEDRLLAACPVLAPRERVVSAMTLAGMTAREIAEELGIAASSVLTYRQRCYHKLGISRAADLLQAVMNMPVHR